MTISLCMIVKNEERKLPVCLASLRGIVDEMIVVDTGSTDRTREIAEAGGARVLEYAWHDDFAAARNFAFAQANGDYIYSADADEEIDPDNRAKFMQLKRDLESGSLEADIVQFLYAGQLSQDSVYNYDREYRPKLFKRLRPFVWEGAVHEQVRLEPMVYDSDIEIQHKPHGQHAGRDLRIFAGMVARGEEMSARLLKLYARELYIAGTAEDYVRAADYFIRRADEENDPDAVEAALLIAARTARLRADAAGFFRHVIRLLDGGYKSSELCLELGNRYLDTDDPAEALVWFLTAVQETRPVLDIRAGGEMAYLGAAACFRMLQDEENEQAYLLLAKGKEAQE
ncbi:MAG: glycosyltransferase family 2 protein [Lachnospiraceae bacterium]|nr:glycosyltransferase family 2 protein [Lachnospiraceae bacterium]